MLLQDQARDAYGRILPIPIRGNTFQDHLEVAHLAGRNWQRRGRNYNFGFAKNGLIELIVEFNGYLEACNRLVSIC